MYYPRSFLKFILLGFLLVSLPLLYALGELILSLDQLQTQGREAVQQAAQAGRASRQLFEQAGMLERIVRQHLILDDSALLDDYDRVRQEFRTTATQLALLPLGARPHWGKCFVAQVAQIEPLYPRIDDFRDLRRRVDPEGKFSNAFLDRVIG